MSESADQSIAESLEQGIYFCLICHKMSWIEQYLCVCQPDNKTFGFTFGHNLSVIFGIQDVCRAGQQDNVCPAEIRKLEGFKNVCQDEIQE